MKYIFLLSGDHVGIAKEEVLSLLGPKKAELVGRLLVSDLDEFVTAKTTRLALTKSIYRLLFECYVSDIKKSMKSFDWNSVYKGDFCVRVHFMDDIANIKNGNKNNKIKQTIRAASESIHSRSNPLANISEKSLAKYIWNSVAKPKVDLENPKTSINLFVAKKAYCCLLVHENKENFESRKAHLRPFSHPSSLHPKLSRALVNLTGVKENEALLDPFCGTGGFLIEAGLMGLKPIGYDISRNMANGCIENLRHYKIRNFKVAAKNALAIDEKFNYVVTDLPYGLNSNVYLGYSRKTLKNKSNRLNLKTDKTKAKAIEQFYLKFLKKLRKMPVKNSVIIFPGYVGYKKLIKASKFEIEKEFSIHVHRSLERKIVRIS